MPANKRKILILTGDAGLGHRSAAEALQKAFEHQFGEQCETAIQNPLNHTKIPDFIRQSQSDYDEIVKAIPELYRLGYDISDSKLPVSLMEDGFTLLLLDVMRESLRDFQPDLILTTYPIYPAPLSSFMESKELNIPVIATVTDLVTVHHVWFHEGLSLLTVPTEIVRQRALDAGLRPEQVKISGIPVDPEIHHLKDVPVKQIRRDLGWDKALTTLLVVGSPRVVALMDILLVLDAREEDFQFALVAGGNDQLHENFQSTRWAHPASVYNFVEFMPRLMRASDLIICKAGGLIVTESLASELPLMLVHVLPGQERGNVGYVVDHGAGALCETPAEASKTLAHWLADGGASLAELSQHAAQAGRADAALEIARTAWEMLA